MSYVDDEDYGDYEEVFEDDNPENRKLDIEAAKLDEDILDMEQEFSDEESGHGVESPILAEYTFINVIWNYENKSIPDGINIELLIQRILKVSKKNVILIIL